MSHKPTPGPWGYLRQHNPAEFGLPDDAAHQEGDPYILGNSHVVTICPPVPECHNVTRDDRNANARLIAAAPTLAQAAKEAAAVLAEHVQYDDPAEPSREAQALKALTAAFKAAGIEER